MSFGPSIHQTWCEYIIQITGMWLFLAVVLPVMIPLVLLARAHDHFKKGSS